MSKISYALLFLGLCLLLILSNPTIGFAQSGQWSRPVEVSGFIGGSEFPTLAVDGTENVYLIWAAVQGEQSNLIYYTRWDGEAWSRPIDIRFGGDHTQLAVDRFGDLNLLYLSGGKATFTTAPSDRATSSKEWRSEIALPGPGSSSALQMAIDDQSVIHVVRTQISTECGSCGDVVYQQSPDGGQTWTDPVTLSVQPADRKRVQLKVDSQGNLHVVWDGVGPNGKNQSVRYSTSIDHGRTWSPSQQFFGPKGPPIQSAVGIGGNDQLVLVWQTVDRDNIYYQVSNDHGTTWGEPAAIPGMAAGKPSTGFDQFDMVSDSSGTLHLAAIGRGANPDVPSLYHLQWDGKGWSKPEAVYTGTDFPEYPTLALSGGNRLHMTWFTRTSDNTSGTPGVGYQVWYSSMVTTAPAAPPIPTFTPAAILTPTASLETPSPTPTTTPFPFQASNPSGSANTSPFLQQLGVLAGILPAVLIIGIVIVIRTRPRRR